MGLDPPAIPHYKPPRRLRQGPRFLQNDAYPVPVPNTLTIFWFEWSGFLIRGICDIGGQREFVFFETPVRSSEFDHGYH
jgi:hypothetical protein